MEYLNCKELTHYNSREFQNGLKFRSLCNDCNNRLLGKEYDPYLIDFSKKVSDIAGLAFNHNFSLPDQISINIYTQRVLRSILGHLLAADIREDMNTPVTNSPYHNILRKYVLDPSESAPEELNVYYWLYPSDIQMIILTSSLSNI